MKESLLLKFSDLENQFASSATAESRPFVGYLCLRTPVELIEALGAVPLRIIPREGYDAGHFNSIRPDGCSFCRMIPSFIQTWHYPRMKALIAGACCDQMRRIIDTLHRELQIPVIFFPAPRVWEINGDFYRKEMEKAFQLLAEAIGGKLDVDIVRERISRRNTLKNEIGRLRNSGKLPNSLLHKFAASPLPPENILRFLADNNEALIPLDSPIRLMLAGSVPGVWELKALESAGAPVTADATCLGDRAFHPLVADYGDPLENLYIAYVEKNLCPHRRPLNPLIDFIRLLADERGIDGIVYLTVKYCHPWGLNAERMKSELAGYPLLSIDDDFTSPAVGSFKTRIGAFVEMLKARIRAEVA